MQQILAASTGNKAGAGIQDPRPQTNIDSQIKYTEQNTMDWMYGWAVDNVHLRDPIQSNSKQECQFGVFFHFKVKKKNYNEQTIITSTQTLQGPNGDPDGVGVTRLCFSVEPLKEVKQRRIFPVWELIRL